MGRSTGASEDIKNAHPNLIIYRKMEGVINKMLSAEDGVPIKTVKSFLSKIPSVFTGQDIIAWILRHIEVADLGDALHFAHLLASHGYIFQIDDHVLTVKNDGTFYRFQTPYFWPSNCWEPENTDYAVYLCKRTMQNKAHLELEDFEAENLAKLQKMFSRKWEFVFMQVDFRKLSRSGRPKYSGSSNSAVVNAALACSENASSSGSPMPYHMNRTSTTTANHDAGNDDGKSESASTSTQNFQRSESSKYHHRPGLRRCTNTQDSLKYEITLLQSRLTKNVLKTSKVVENYLQYHEHRKPFDAFLNTPGNPNDPFQSHPNPWISDTVDFWQHDKITGDISTRRLKLWEESFEELLADQLGRETLQKFLDKEYSGENLRFWWEVQKLRKCSCRMVPVLVTEIYNEFIAATASSPVNIDCKVLEITETNLNNPNRWSFDEAADHIYCLMKNDSYQRFLRSDIYKDLVNISRKKNSLSALISRKTSRKNPLPRSQNPSKNTSPSNSTTNCAAAAAMVIPSATTAQSGGVTGGSPMEMHRNNSHTSATGFFATASSSAPSGGGGSVAATATTNDSTHSFLQLPSASH